MVKVGNHIKQRLEAEFSPLPCVGNIGGMGLNYALELVENKNSRKPIDPATKKELVQNLLANGIYTRIIGRLGNRLHIGPPSTTTVDEADKALDEVRLFFCPVSGTTPGRCLHPSESAEYGREVC